MRYLAPCLLILASSHARLDAQVLQNYSVTLSVTQGQDSKKATITSVIEGEGAGEGYETSRKAFSTKIESILAQYGTVTDAPGGGFGKVTKKLEVNLQKSDTNGIANSQLEKNLLLLGEAFEPVKDKFSDIYFAGGVPYIELGHPSSYEISRFMLCVKLDYLSNVKKTLTLPRALKAKMDLGCKGNVSISELRYATSIYDKNVKYTSAQKEIDWLQELQYFSPILMEKHISKCSAADLSELADYTASGWVDSSKERSAKDNCIFKSYQNFFDMKDLVDNGFKASVLSNPITPYYKSLVSALIDLQKSELISIDSLKKDLRTSLANIPSLADGYSKIAIDLAHFNVAAYNEGLAASHPDVLLARLLSPSAAVDPSLKNFLKSSSEEDTSIYLERLKAYFERKCRPQAFALNCIRSGLADLPGNQVKVKILFGSTPEAIWDGFYFF